MRRSAFWVAAWVVLGAPPARAGNLPVFYDGSAGPYHLRVRIDPPDVIPGMARVEIQGGDSDISRIRLLAVPIDNRQRAYSPVPDTAERVAGQASAFSGRCWLMTSGSWEVRLLVDGARGDGTLAVPVAALPTHVAGMPLALGLVLLGLLLVLALGMVGIAAAAVREGQLGPGQSPGPAEHRKASLATWVAAAILVAIVVFGGFWWSASERAYARSVYRPLNLMAELAPGGRRLALTLTDPGWLPSRELADLASSEGHRLDLWVVQNPGFEHVWHLRPAQIENGQFDQTLPPMPAGRYALFARLVHADGLEETARGEITLPMIPEPPGGEPASPDEAVGQGGPLGSAEAAVAALPLGGRIRLDTDGPQPAGQPVMLRFHVEDRPVGYPALDLEPLDGRRALGALVSGDLSTFEPLSSRGTTAPAAWKIANPDAGEAVELGLSDFAFEGEFPQAGRYRLLVEIRRGGRDEIALFDFRAF